MRHPPKISLVAPAKLNLFLHITGRREDGYHELQTVFQLLNFGDELELSRRDDGQLNLSLISAGELEDLVDGDNLVVRAAQLLREEACDLNLGAELKLTKRLPAGGGVGGGSSDAATTLLGLNAIWNLDFNLDRLADLGASLGADVPVFVRGQSAWAEGVGERLTPVKLPDHWFVVIHPNCHVSTQEIFSHPELTRDTPAITIAAFFAGPTQNDCQNLVRRLANPVDKALIWLDKFGKARLTGTGACVFLSFIDEASATAVLEQLPSEWQGFVARGVNRSPVMEQLNAQGY